MDLATILEILNAGSNGVIVLIIYFLWKMDKKLTVFIAESEIRGEMRNQEIQQIKIKLDKVA